MKRHLFFSVVISTLFFTSCTVNHQITVAFYNVENLFDTINSGVKLDSEFTPNSEKQWNTAKYKKKIDDLSKVISVIDKKGFPVLVGLAEIENNHVLDDLVANRHISKAGYKFVWNDSPDLRGIDCALLYNPAVFKLVKVEMIPVVNPNDTAFITRDVLLAEGVMGKEKFYVFVNHWPSRREGEEVSLEKRNLAAAVVRQKVDQLFEIDVTANIIIMGDMNDEPENESLAKTLGAKPNTTEPIANDLVNLMYDESIRKEGSYYYRGNWDMIDNMIVSGSLIVKEKGLGTTLNDGHIFHQKFMEFVNDRGEITPNRTYGKTYYGGISDHFPIYMSLEIR